MSPDSSYRYLSSNAACETHSNYALYDSTAFSPSVDFSVTSIIAMRHACHTMTTAVSTWRPGFNAWPVHEIFLVHKVAMWQVFFISSGFPCQYRSTNILYSSSSSICCDQEDKKEEGWELWNKSVLFRYREALDRKWTAHRTLVGKMEGKRWLWIPRLWEYIIHFYL